jgi:hypothetical protein
VHLGKVAIRVFGFAMIDPYRTRPGNIESVRVVCSEKSAAVRRIHYFHSPLRDIQEFIIRCVITSVSSSTTGKIVRHWLRLEICRLLQPASGGDPPNEDMSNNYNVHEG